MQVAVVRNGEGIHAQGHDPIQQIRDPVRTVEQGVFAVRVEMNERHRVRLKSDAEDTGGHSHCQNRLCR